MDFEAHKKALVAHYVAMARVPGSREQAKHSVDELAREWPEFYGDLAELVRAELRSPQVAEGVSK